MTCNTYRRPISQEKMLWWLSSKSKKKCINESYGSVQCIYIYFTIDRGVIHNRGISLKFKLCCTLQNPIWFTTSADNIYPYELKLSPDLCQDNFTSYLCAHHKSSTEFTCLPGNIRSILSLTRCLKKYWVIKVRVKIWHGHFCMPNFQSNANALLRTTFNSWRKMSCNSILPQQSHSCPFLIYFQCHQMQLLFLPRYLGSQPFDILYIKKFLTGFIRAKT